MSRKVEVRPREVAAPLFSLIPARSVSYTHLIALKHYLQDSGLPGTVKFFGCPAEENGSGKGFMARDGVFNGVDIAFSWHPGEVNSVSTESTLANYQISYRFQGVSAHAAMSPELSLIHI